ncbi:MAG: glycosyltransferase family 9 protein [Elusimicrobia bacterium]|nr:glycosyltransferase family 9 protein [Elusimicrobiota bacterium]
MDGRKAAVPDKPVNILVRLPNWLGDIVMSAAFLNMLPEVFAGAEMSVIVKKELSGIMALFPRVKRVYEYSRDEYPGLKGMMKYMSKIRREEKFDLYFCLPESFSSALMGFLSGAPARIGYKGQLRSFLLTRGVRKPVGLHRVQEYAFLLDGFGGNVMERISAEITVPESDILRELGIMSANRLVVVNMNSRSQSRRVPVEKAAQIIDRLLKSADCTVVLTGDREDIEYSGNVSGKLSSGRAVVNLTGKTDLVSLAKLLKKCDLLISSDSGTAHLANSIGTKVIVLFGAGDEKNTAPYNRKDLVIVKAEGISCAPCVSNECSMGSPRCLEEIDTEEIIDYAMDKLGV